MASEEEKRRKLREKAVKRLAKLSRRRIQKKTDRLLRDLKKKKK